MFKKLFLISFLLYTTNLSAQSIIQHINLPFYKVNALKAKEDSLIEQFTKAKFDYPVKQMLIRSFKLDHQLEVWVRNNENEPFTLFKNYRVCAMGGDLGPKRIEGDMQVPEGFYYISEFKPNSEFHLSLKLNYPNESDKLLSNKQKPGGEIYIHGSCVSVGCIPLQNDQIEEVYLLANAAKINGQKYIPVHVFPFRFNNYKGLKYYTNFSANNIQYQRFVLSLKNVYDYFEKTKQLPLIGINTKGEYELLNAE